jgi:hypothetical protein
LGVAHIFLISDIFWIFQIAMHFLASREYPVIDDQTMAELVGHERLFRSPNGVFWLHMSSDGKAGTEERIIQLTARDTITWLNEEPEQFGSFWEFAVVAPTPGKALSSAT